MAKELSDLFEAAPEEGNQQTEATETTETEETTESTETTESKEAPESTETTETTETVAPKTEETTVESTPYNFEDFNKRFSTSFKEDADVSAFMEKSAKVEGLEKTIKEHTDFKTKNQELEAKVQTLEEGLDPLKYFANESEFKAQQLKMQFPDKDPYTIQKIMDKDLSKMSDVEVLALKTVLDTPGLLGGEAGAREYVEREFYGEDGTAEDADSFTKNKLTIAATAARNEMNALKAVEMPEIQTAEGRQKVLDEQKASIKEAWSPFMDQLITPGTLEIKDKDGEKLFDFETGESVGAKEYFETLFTEGGLSPTEENLSMAMEERDKQIIYDNLPQILSVYANQLEGKVLESTDKELNNDKLPNTAEKSDEEASKSASGIDQFMSDQKGKTSSQPIG